MKRKIIYLINPISGVGTKSAVRELIIKENSLRNTDFEILPTVADGNYSFLREKISTDGITDIVVCGGDGSVNSVAASLMGIDINVGIIPLGSGNGLARTAGISGKPQKALETIFTGKPEFINGFYVNGDFSCMLCGIGFDARVAHDFAEEPGRGLKTYIKVALRNFLKAKSHPFVIKLNKESFAVDAFFISIANSNQFGNNFKIAPKAELSDDLLDIVIVKKMSKVLLPFSVLWQVTGINPIQATEEFRHDKNIMYFQASSLDISNHEGALMHIDGEPKETASHFEIRLISKAFRLIMPGS